MIEVIEVKTKKQWKDFATFPIKLYKDSKYYVPAFVTDDMYMANEKKNFSAKNCIVKAFLAYKDGILAGRIAGIEQIQVCAAKQAFVSEGDVVAHRSNHLIGNHIL